MACTIRTAFLEEGSRTVRCWHLSALTPAWNACCGMDPPNGQTPFATPRSRMSLPPFTGLVYNTPAHPNQIPSGCKRGKAD